MTDNTSPIFADPDLLTTRDLIRARAMLGGADPWDKLRAGHEERFALTYWCLRTRTEPGYSYEAALDAPIVEFLVADEPDPQMPAPAGNGASPASGAERASPTTPNGSTSEPAASPTSA